MAEIANVIDELLNSKGLSGAKMSSDLGMSRSFMTELRSGRAKGITVETAAKIASYLGVSVSYLIGEEKMPTVSDGQKETPGQPELTEAEAMMLQSFKRFPDVDQRSIVEMLDSFHALPEGTLGSALEIFQAFLKML